ncbi:MAG: heavy metal-associated domain-containing protein [Bacteroidota bacterium]
MKTKICLLILLLALSSAKAQFSVARIKVNGLTCSACSYATQKSLLELDFVDSVKMDLNTNLAVVTFKPSKKIDIQLLSKKVYDAGFSVGSLTAIFTFNSYTLSENGCFDFEGDLYHFEKTASQILNGATTLQFIGKKYMDKTEQKKWKDVKIEDNCKQDKNFSGNIYNVIVQ